MTTIKGGMSAVNKVILYPNKFMIPKLQITPIITTARESRVALMDLKKIKRMIADNKTDPTKNQRISF